MRLLLMLFLCLLCRPVLAGQAVQPWIDAAAPGSRLELPPGVYSGPGVIRKPLSIEGRGKVIIDGGGRGTVLTVLADQVSLSGLQLSGSGDSHDALDSALHVEGRQVILDNLTIDDALFGIVLHNTTDSLLRNSRIRSKAYAMAERGDGLRLWNSHGNQIVGNDFSRIRDITISNATHNRFVGNRVRDSRRAFNLLFARRSLIDGNRFEHNATGITALNSEGLIIRNNQIVHAMDASGAGVALKETSSALVVGNDIVHCAHGIMADSPMDPLNRIALIDNRLAHNITGIYFYGQKGGHIGLGNRFENNLWQVTVIGDGDASDDLWLGNYWDDYQGFDRNADGIGDTPHEIYSYADRIWIETPGAKFFRNSPLLELLDFLERLAPFSPPDLILRDTAPRVHKKP